MNTDTPQPVNTRPRNLKILAAVAIGVFTIWAFGTDDGRDAVLGERSEQTTSDSDSSQTQLTRDAFEHGWEGMTNGERARMCAAYNTLPASETIDPLMDELDPQPEAQNRDAVRQEFITLFNEACE